MERFQLEVFDIPLKNRAGKFDAVLRYVSPCVYKLVFCEDLPIRVSLNSSTGKDGKQYYEYIDLSEGPMLAPKCNIEFTVDEFKETDVRIKSVYSVFEEGASDSYGFGTIYVELEKPYDYEK